MSTALWLLATTLVGTASAGFQVPPAQQANLKFSVPQVANPAYAGYATTGQSAMVRAFVKHGIALPQMIQDAANTAANKFASGSVAAYPMAYDSEFLSQVAIGTPAQYLFVDFDTGSSDLWVYSTETYYWEVNGQTEYNPSKSTSASKLAGETWQIGYGDGSNANGDVWIDTINVGGAVVSNQAIEAAINVSPSFTQDSSLDGLFGLAFGQLNQVRPDQQQTFFANIQSRLSQGLFTADLRSGQAGSYNFGYIDTSRLTGPVSYTALDNSSGFWGVTSNGFRAGNIVTTMTIPSIVDTGTTLLVLPDLVTEAYYAQVQGGTFSVAEGGWIFPCGNGFPTPPDFSLQFGSYFATVPGAYINFAPSVTQQGYCFGGLQSSGDMGINILGDVFIKSQMVVFDAQNSRVGFAPKSLP